MPLGTGPSNSVTLTLDRCPRLVCDECPVGLYDYTINQAAPVYNKEMTVEFECPPGYTCEPLIIPEDTNSYIPDLTCEHPDSPLYPCSQDCNDPTHPDYPCEDGFDPPDDPIITPTEENGPVFYNDEQEYDCEDAELEGTDSVVVPAGSCSGVTKVSANLAAYNLAKARFEQALAAGDVECQCDWLRHCYNSVNPGPVACELGDLAAWSNERCNSIDFSSSNTIDADNCTAWQYTVESVKEIGPYDESRELHAELVYDLNGGVRNVHLGVPPCGSTANDWFVYARVGFYTGENKTWPPIIIATSPILTPPTLNEVGTITVDYTLPASTVCYVIGFIQITRGSNGAVNTAELSYTVT